MNRSIFYAPTLWHKHGKNMRNILIGLIITGCSAPKIAELEQDDVNIITDEDGDGYLSDEDCNDNDASVNLGAAEICDGVDNNCDGDVDEGVMDTFYADTDADGFGDPNNNIEACSAPENYVDTPSDCDDRSAEVFPGNTELCDDIDNNCDGTIDEGVGDTFYLDQDRDGYGVEEQEILACSLPVGYSTQIGDCDDTNALAYPDALEICDGIDNNCNGEIDTNAINSSLFFADFDEDDFGDPNTPIFACVLPQGAVENDEDCNDVDTAINPSADEICDTQDNNCNGLVDESTAIDASTWYADADGDGFGTTSTVQACTQPTGFASVSGDCNDSSAENYPQNTETCDNIDNNCDGNIDEGLLETWYLDYDGDGFGNASFFTQSCTQPNNYVLDNSDCNDLSAVSYEGATELCDGIDNDCDGSIDNNAPDILTLFEDTDGDGYGSNTSIESCTLQSGYSLDDGDCDDDDPNTSPTSVEICDGVDNNCNGVTDDELLGSGPLCPAESCLDILESDSSNGSASYWLDWDGSLEQKICDMNTDGGGWTAVVHWNREDDGDGWPELRSEMTETYNNMTEQDTGSNYIRWSDSNTTGDVMAFERDVPFTNQGEVLLDIYYYGYSLENSGMYFFGETSNGFENILCKDDTYTGLYTSLELGYAPYNCATSSATSWTWDDAYLSTLNDSISTLHFRSMHYDGGGGDRSYLYRLIMWVR